VHGGALAVEGGKSGLVPGAAVVVAVDEAAGLAEGTVGEADAGDGKQVAGIEFDDAYFRVAMVGVVGDSGGTVPGLAAIVGEDGGVAVVTVVTGGRRDVERICFDGLGAGVDEGSVGKVDDVAGFAADVVALDGLAPGMAFVVAPEEVVGHAAGRLLPEGEAGPVVA